MIETNKNGIIPELLFKEHNKFSNHLETNGNERILFSGMFGIGKTTFLNHFFNLKENKDIYNVFHLYPVNYSVLNNDDIFKYIKYDIIYELIEKKYLSFNHDEVTFVDKLPNFAKKNLYKLSASLLLLIPKMGRQLFQLSQELEKLNKIFVDYSDSKSKEKKELLNLINSYDKKDGDLYEFNVLTELIYRALLRLKEKSKNVKNILVIDDLDRIDPKHIFRLFNIFSAHFDRSIGFEKNKFGFDKIILVCDIENIRNIYSHFYGLRTDFNGYIDKFYSREIYYYDNIKNISGYLEKLFNAIQFKGDFIQLTNYFNEDDKLRKFLIFLFHNFINLRIINLRSLLKNYNRDFDLSRIEIDNPKSHDNIQDWKVPIFHVLRVASNYFTSINSFKDALHKCAKSDKLYSRYKGNNKFFLADVIQGIDILKNGIDRLVFNSNSYYYVDEENDRRISYSESIDMNLDVYSSKLNGITKNSNPTTNTIEIRTEIIFDYLIQLVDLLERKKYFDETKYRIQKI